VFFGVKYRINEIKLVLFTAIGLKIKFYKTTKYFV